LTIWGAETGLTQISPFNELNLQEKTMSTAPISSLTSQPVNTTSPVATSAKSHFQEYLKARKPEVAELEQALKAGDLKAATQAYNDLVALGQKDLGKDNPFLLNNRALDFNAIGGALQNGDIQGARHAFRALEKTFDKTAPPQAASGVTPDAIVNLSTRGT
jgi:hypothetical protein